MVEVFIKGRLHRTNAMAVFDEMSGKITVKQGSIVSEDIAEYRNKSKMEKLRKEYVNPNNEVNQDVEFDNCTTAAQFVCGYSVSGISAWHTEPHKTLKEFLG